MILLIDNYDSFVHNLARYIERLGHETQVVRNDRTTVDKVSALGPKAVILSPGPCTPSEAGICVELVRRLHNTIPILGVCLGHQAIAAAFGAEIIRAPEPIHGRTSDIQHDGNGCFAGLANPLSVCRYHSLVVNDATISPPLEVTARTKDGTVMGIRHIDRPVVGVQFHPESILTDAGLPLIAGFFRRANVGLPAPLPDLQETAFRARPQKPLPTNPVTF